MIFKDHSYTFSDMVDMVFIMFILFSLYLNLRIFYCINVWMYIHLLHVFFTFSGHQVRCS